MNAQRMTRVIAGLLILLSLVLAHVMGQADLTKVSWLWFTAFIGLNLFQSGLTNWCLMTSILSRLGMRPA